MAKPHSLCDDCIRQECAWRTPTGIRPPIKGCESFIRKPPTNADRIRVMSDEELATYLSCLFTAQYHIGADPHVWLNWLKADAKEK